MKPGDIVSVITKKEELEGVVMPNSDDKVLMLKLKSGYNTGVKRASITKMTVKKKAAKKKSKAKKVTQNKKLPTISIIHTGGTVASKVDYETGAVVSRFSPEEILELAPELKEIANIRSVFIGNMFSGDMNFNHINLIAQAVAKEITHSDGIIVTHGTDTMTYSCAALAFILDGLTTPVLYVGSQRSSDRGSSDGKMNLLCAAQFLTKSDFGEVGICMHAGMDDTTCAILPATKSRKMHTSRRDTFKPINTTAWANVNVSGKITVMNNEYTKKKKQTSLKPQLLNPKLKIGYYKFHPGMRSEELLFYKNYDGLVVEGTGLGNGPVNVIDEYTKENAKILLALSTLAKKMPVVMTSQCIYGRLNMNVYNYGRKIQEAGVLGNLADMVPETAYVKLAWLLSNKKDVKKEITQNLRGEISSSIAPEKDFTE